MTAPAQEIGRPFAGRPMWPGTLRGLDVFLPNSVGRRINVAPPLFHPQSATPIASARTRLSSGEGAHSRTHNRTVSMAISGRVPGRISLAAATSVRIAGPRFNAPERGGETRCAQAMKHHQTVVNG